jgi:hypothetical protein
MTPPQPAPPSSDFPAAHSMDTTWFAVDRDGHVAVFDSGEAGAVPVEGYNEDWAPILDELTKAAGGLALDADDDDAWADRPNRLAAMGLFFYTHEEFENGLAGPYDRTGVPETPMPGHQVPRGLLKQMVSFDGSFADTERLQPVEHWHSDAWSEAWVSVDGKHVTCVPGHEDEYAKHFDDLKEAFSDKDVTFDPPGAAKPQPPPTAKALPSRRWWQFWKK